MAAFEMDFEVKTKDGRRFEISAITEYFPPEPMEVGELPAETAIEAMEVYEFTRRNPDGVLFQPAFEPDLWQRFEDMVRDRTQNAAMGGGLK